MISPDPQYLLAEYDAICAAKAAYLDALEALQASCEHPVVLKHTDDRYMTFRVCETCGYHEQVQWDSHFRYTDQRLLKRAYDVSWSEYYAALPKVRPDDLDVARARARVARP